MKTCKVCGESFASLHGNEKYCSDQCREKGTSMTRYKHYTAHYKQKYKSKRVDSICWTCKNACGGCSWSRSLTPVEGWKAELVTNKTMNDDNLKSYKVISCPEYIEGR